MTTLSETAKAILSRELPFDTWAVDADIRVEEDAEEVRVYPMSGHATEYIGEGQHLSFSKGA